MPPTEEENYEAISRSEAEHKYGANLLTIQEANNNKPKASSKVRWIIGMVCIVIAVTSLIIGIIALGLLSKYNKQTESDIKDSAHTENAAQQGLEAAISAKQDDLLLQLKAILLEDVLTRIDAFRNQSDDKHEALKSHLSQIDVKLSAQDDRVGASDEALQSHLTQIDLKLSAQDDKVDASDESLQSHLTQIDVKLSAQDDTVGALDESLQSHLTQIDLKLSAQDDKVGALDEALQSHLTQIDLKLSAQDDKVGALDEALQSHLTQIDLKLSAQDDKVGALESQLQDIQTKLSSHDTSIQSDLSKLKTASCSQAGASPSGAFDANDYTFYNSKRSWSSAKTYCNNSGERLVSLQSFEEWEFVKGLISIHQYRAQCDEFWTEGHKRSDSWFWGSSSEHVAYNWDEDEPSGDGDCAEFDSWDDMGLNDEDCSTYSCFICEK